MRLPVVNRLHLDNKRDREVCKATSAWKHRGKWRPQMLVVDCRTFVAWFVRDNSCSPTTPSSYPTHRQLQFTCECRPFKITYTNGDPLNILDRCTLVFKNWVYIKIKIYIRQ